MSAIFGILVMDGSAVEEELLQKMKDSLLPYGRDDQQVYVRENAGFGSCINHLNGKCERDLPVFSDNDFETVLVADAQIYNREELLGKYLLSTDRETSNNGLLMAAYRKWGEDCVKHINGDFAFAVYDYTQKKLFLAVDHLGVRPLYYYSDESVFIFASDERAILSLGLIPKKMDEVLVYRLLSRMITFDAERTAFSNLRKLPQAHVLVLNDGSISKRKYWAPGAGGEIVFDTEEEYATALRETVENAIKIRLENVSEHVGAELSGGLDSSVISIYAARYMKQKGKELPLYSWSPSFEAYPEQQRDERKLIRKVCEQEELTCRFFSPRAPNDVENLSGESFKVINDEMDFMTSKDVRCVFSGWGGDQAISHRANLSELYANGYRKQFYSEIHRLSGASFLRKSKLALTYGLIPALQRKWGRAGIAGKQLNFMTKTFQKKMKKIVAPIVLEFNNDLLKHLESGNIQTRTLSVAKIGAENGIQYIFPYLDHRVVDFAFSIPRHLFYKNGMNRYIYRKAFSGLLPKELCYYTPKDDIAKLTYFSGIQHKIEEQLEIITDDLRRDLFGDYIDFEKLNLMISSGKKENSHTEMRKLSRKLDECRKLQEFF